MVVDSVWRHCMTSGTVGEHTAAKFDGTVADWLERSVCNEESTGSSLVRDSYHVGTLSKFFAHNCSAVLLHLRWRGV